MKKVLITGISRGIGKAEALKFLAEGYAVVGSSIDGNIDYTHPNVQVFPLDLRKESSISSFIKHIKNNKLSFDIVIHNAGALFDDEVIELRIPELRKTLEVNLIGTADVSEQLLPFLNKDAHVLFTSSSAGSITNTDYKKHPDRPSWSPAYRISKAAINMYMRTLSTRMAHDPRNIVVSSVHPGWVKTDMGGDEAPMTPEEAADYIYNLAISRPETGQFWFKGEKYPW